MHRAKLFVGNLHSHVTDIDLKKLFSNYGKVKLINLVKDKGFGFIEMSTQDEARNAQIALNGSEFMGQRIDVDAAMPFTSSGESPVT
ncbi:RNA-binding protein [bacterium]|nr:RNA-binding protein [candidate division CSSED10-310 bacterium]